MKNSGHLNRWVGLSITIWRCFSRISVKAARYVVCSLKFSIPRGNTENTKSIRDYLRIAKAVALGSNRMTDHWISQYSKCNPSWPRLGEAVIILMFSPRGSVYAAYCRREPRAIWISSCAALAVLQHRRSYKFSGNSSSAPCIFPNVTRKECWGSEAGKCTMIGD